MTAPRLNPLTIHAELSSLQATAAGPLIVVQFIYTSTMSSQWFLLPFQTFIESSLVVADYTDGGCWCSCRGYDNEIITA